MSEHDPKQGTKDRLYEALSATLDGQADELELRRVLEGVSSDDELKQKAMNYQRIGDTIRQQNNAFASIDLTAGIRQAIEQEAVEPPASEPERFRALRRTVKRIKKMGEMNGFAGRFAVAASVFCAVLLSARYYVEPRNYAYTVADNSQNISSNTLVQPAQIARNSYGGSSILAGANSPQSTSYSTEQLAFAQSTADRATRERFQAYALQHAELSVMNSGQGVLPFARLTSFDVK